ncbi:PWWP domain-containing protein 5-like [Amaranthus tricolor]|uniref:PWWP domain-containing protein 5-like n=1 Tax=Amaranthus tricolor TaxID=29722 RepID=UPI002585D654|nr:PWWP domain-containing protein 5-like [Amaranthus tricolor]
MQSDVVPDDFPNNNVVNSEINDTHAVSMNETLAQDKGLGRENESQVMQVDHDGEGNSGVVSEILSGKREGKGSGNDLGMVVVQEKFNSSAQNLVLESVNDDKYGNESKSESEKAAIFSASEVDLDVENRAVVSDNDGKDGEKSKGFYPSDLVWGKVRSHPWWPGQIFEPGDASDKARKYSKSKGYLIGYFGDQTFAWNSEAKLKSFAPNFSQMVKQTNMEAFHHAVGCVLDEISRRVEFGLSCRCIVDDVYNRLKTQVVENTGIREKSRIREGGDRFFSASSFEPLNFLGYVKDLALGSCTNVDKLERVVARAQTSAFYRWKGIYHLAEFGLLMGYVNNEAGIMVEDDNRVLKRKKTSGDTGRSTEKAKNLSDLIGKSSVSKKIDEETKKNARSKSVASSIRKRKKVDLLPDDSKVKETSAQRTDTLQSRATNPSFRVGESILKVAGRLNQRSPLLKLDGSSKGKPMNDEGNSKLYDKHNPEYVSVDVVLVQLHLAATEPFEKHDLLSKMVNFISHFRNSVVPDSELLQKLEDSGDEGAVGKPKEGSTGSDPAEMADPEAVKNACCSDMFISAPERKVSSSGVKMAVVDGVSGCSQETDSTVSCPRKLIQSDNGASEQEDSPTALTLKFSDLDSIPSEAKLNKIFSHFGSLKESETEVLTKKSCARVVFKRRSDAETAFSSSGKFEIFGPSLVCYRLNDATSPHKSASVEPKRRKKLNFQ